MDSKKILIVDDEPDILRLASLRLKKLGYDVIMAVNGKEALDMMQDEKPDLVLLDLLLPVISGDEVCKKAKNNKNLKHIPIILFSAGTGSMAAEKVKEFRAEDYIVKPFDPDELIEKINKILTEKAIP